VTSPLAAVVNGSPCSWCQRARSLNCAPVTLIVRLNLSTFPFVRGVCGRVNLCAVPVCVRESLKIFERYAGPLSVRQALDGRDAVLAVEQPTPEAEPRSGGGSLVGVDFGVGHAAVVIDSRMDVDVPRSVVRDPSRGSRGTGGTRRRWCSPRRWFAPLQESDDQIVGLELLRAQRSSVPAYARS
jgi:hypothetical protein